MKSKPTLLLFLLFTCFGFTQDKQLNPLYQVSFLLYKTTQDTITIKEASTLSYQDKSHFTKTHPDDIYWVKLDFFEHSSLLSRNNWILRTGYLNKGVIFYQTENGIQSKIMGSFQLNKNFTGQFPFTKKSLIDGRYLYLKFSISTVRSSLAKKGFVFYPETLSQFREQFVSKRYLSNTNISHLFLGGAIMGVLMALVFYATHRRREYLFYILYIIGVGLYLLRGVWDFYDTVIGLYSKTSFVLNAVLEMLSNIFYLLFVRYFLDTKNKYPLLNKVISYAIVILVVLIIVESTSIMIARYSWHLTLLDVRASFLSVLVLFGMVYLIINRKTNLNWFIVVGSFLYGLGSMLLYAFANGDYLKMGVLAEITIFLLGLGYKIRMENEEKTQLQEVAIQNYRKLLRSQLDPHFIFNSLNSIQHLITTNKRVSAIKYLNKFSRLMRQTMENSIENNILLSEEIQFLNTYIQLESLRFDNSFKYKISVDKNIRPNHIEVPQLMIQPFVENAILHGLLNKKEVEKHLDISFSEKGIFLECIIDDNGIGRKASGQLKRFQKNRKSRGMEVTQKRISSLFYDQTDKKLLTITDKTDAKGNPTGTTVVLKIPLQE
ncbi:histidine kinase [Galbibacter sp. EGI 63066]|uniref:sensor histidine kinase n=1 Tax=Galbibacter sp. EGI 63066 TaxID=2993559 RepID=UPI0022488F92|nr:histidine kinase [Galbibacter sp. EGI 63066]MCX2678443.1 histidine kinase [Galbibacter sp. EGI 63066]